jgi:2'-5' RNA ligase
LNVIRSFIAIDLSPEIIKNLEKLIGQIKGRLPELPIRWVPANKIHLTLKFLGDVSESNIEMLEKILGIEASNYPPFEISVGGLGAFPSIRRPRVIWVGVETPDELTDFQQSIETETARLGYAREKRIFSPHLTLGRVSRNANAEEVRQIGEVLCNCKVGFLGATRVRAVHLYRSDLKPTGAVYTQLDSASFSKNDN